MNIIFPRCFVSEMPVIMKCLFMAELQILPIPTLMGNLEVSGNFKMIKKRLEKSLELIKLSVKEIYVVNIFVAFRLRYFVGHGLF